jgi:archaetidylinositol phosphate synthase
MAVLTNLGLSTQLVVLGVCLVAGAPELYLWLVVSSAALLPLLQLRRERLALSALRAA